jgi:hypothetical protein
MMRLVAFMFLLVLGVGGCSSADSQRTTLSTDPDRYPTNPNGRFWVEPNVPDPPAVARKF